MMKSMYKRYEYRYHVELGNAVDMHFQTEWNRAKSKRLCLLTEAFFYF